MGEYSYGNPELSGHFDVTVGKFCSIASGVLIMSGDYHRVDWVTTFAFIGKWEEAKDFKGHPTGKGPVIIGNDVWIGRNALILSGVTIGDGAVIGANSVVSKDVEPYALVVGNPARVVKKRFTDKQVECLLIVAWWDWSRDKIVAALPLLLSDNVDDFINAYYNVKEK